MLQVRTESNVSDSRSSALCFCIHSQMGKRHFSSQWLKPLETLPPELASWEFAQPGFMEAASLIYRGPILKWLQRNTSTA